MAVSAALGLAALSSSASAQPGDSQYCEELAWATCNPNHDPWYPYMYHCWWDTYEACMGGRRAPVVSEPVDVGRRAELAAVRR